MAHEAELLVATRPRASTAAWALVAAACVGAVAGLLATAGVPGGAAHLLSRPVTHLMTPAPPVSAIARSPSPGAPGSAAAVLRGAEASRHHLAAWSSHETGAGVPMALMQAQTPTPLKALWGASAAAAALVGMMGLLAARRPWPTGSEGDDVVAMTAVSGQADPKVPKRKPADERADLQLSDDADGMPLSRLRQRVNSLFGHRLAQLGAFRADPFHLADQLLADVQAEFRDFRTAADVWHPSADVKETDDAVTFHCDVPGVRKEDLQIDLQGNRLVISGKREQQQSQSGQDNGWLYTERSFGSFSRSFGVPPGTKPTDVSAVYRDGVLDVTVKKQPPTAPGESRIPIA